MLYVPDMLRGLAFKPVYMSDAIHPNDAGYQKIAERLEKKLKMGCWTSRMSLFWIANPTRVDVTLFVTEATSCRISALYG